jgi:hypothetical protein
MGEFLDAEDLKAKPIVDLIRQLECDDLDDLFIIPAEKAIEDACNLNLDTDADPYHWRGRFEQEPGWRDKFRADYRRSVILLVNRWATNPHALGSQSVSGGSAVYGGRFPTQIYSLMRKWGMPNRLSR